MQLLSKLLYDMLMTQLYTVLPGEETQSVMDRRRKLEIPFLNITENGQIELAGIFNAENFNLKTICFELGDKSIQNVYYSLINLFITTENFFFNNSYLRNDGIKIMRVLR